MTELVPYVTQVLVVTELSDGTAQMVSVTPGEDDKGFKFEAVFTDPVASRQLGFRDTRTFPTYMEATKLKIEFEGHNFDVRLTRVDGASEQPAPSMGALTSAMSKLAR